MILDIRWVLVFDLNQGINKKLYKCDEYMTDKKCKRFNFCVDCRKAVMGNNVYNGYSSSYN